MASLAFTIEPDEVRGLRALADLEAAAGGTPGTAADADVVSRARILLRAAVADKLEEAGLLWAPSEADVRNRAAEMTAPAGAVGAFWGSGRVRKSAASVVAAALLVVLWGGYVRGWRWTGFRENGQLWDWLSLLLLPVVLGTIPLWIRYREYIGKGRRAGYAAAAVAWTVFVIAGYLVPLAWTGFPRQTLWNWLVLLVLPAAVTVTMTLISRSARGRRARLRRRHQALITAVTTGWVVTVVGGYNLQWTWTGYAGNTLWNWLQLLAPLVFPALVLPSLLRWVSGNAAERARAARAAAVTGAAAGQAP